MNLFDFSNLILKGGNPRTPYDPWESMQMILNKYAGFADLVRSRMGRYQPEADAAYSILNNLLGLAYRFAPTGTPSPTYNITATPYRVSDAAAKTLSRQFGTWQIPDWMQKQIAQNIAPPPDVPKLPENYLSMLTALAPTYTLPASLRQQMNPELRGYQVDPSVLQALRPTRQVSPAIASALMPKVDISEAGKQLYEAKLGAGALDAAKLMQDVTNRARLDAIARGGTPGSTGLNPGTLAMMLAQQQQANRANALQSRFDLERALREEARTGAMALSDVQRQAAMDNAALAMNLQDVLRQQAMDTANLATQRAELAARLAGFERGLAQDLAEALNQRRAGAQSAIDALRDWYNLQLSRSRLAGEQQAMESEMAKSLGSLALDQINTALRTRQLESENARALEQLRQQEAESRLGLDRARNEAARQAFLDLLGAREADVDTLKTLITLASGQWSDLMNLADPAQLLQFLAPTLQAAASRLGYNWQADLTGRMAGAQRTAAWLGLLGTLLGRL